jgi:hypothetical protein
MKIVMKDEGFKHFSKKDIYDWEEILGIIEEMEDEIVSLNEKISDMEDDIRDNYKPIPLSEMYGVSDRDFY